MNNDIVVIAGCLVEKDGKFLLVQEAQPRAYGLWNTPAGHIDEGESVKQAAVRETKEESGYDVSIERELYIYQTENNHEIHIFLARVTGGDLRFPKDEILDASWLTNDEIRILESEQKLRGPYVVSAIDEYMKGTS